MRVNLNAILNVGVVSVPVGVATAAKRKEKEFRTLHKECETPIQLKMWCQKHDRVLQVEEIAKGYEFAKGQFLVLDTAELEEMTEEKSKVIQIRKFVPEAQIADYVERSYYLVPNDSLLNAYVLLMRAMEANGLVGIGTSILWGKENPCAVRATENGLMLSMLYCFDEVNSAAEIREIIDVETKEAEQKLADTLVATLASDLDPEEDLVSESRTRIAAYIENKLAGQEVKPLVARDVPDFTPDLLASLKESLADAKKAKAKRKAVKA